MIMKKILKKLNIFILFIDDHKGNKFDFCLGNFQLNACFIQLNEKIKIWFS